MPFTVRSLEQEKMPGSRDSNGKIPSLQIAAHLAVDDLGFYGQINKAVRNSPCLHMDRPGSYRPIA